MRLFSKLFGSSSDIEKQLEDKYVRMFQEDQYIPIYIEGSSLSEAKTIFRAELKKVKEESLKEGTFNLSPNFGDVLLKKESTDEEIKARLAKKRKEGVRDEDIRWFWNMHDLERRMMVKVDRQEHFTTYVALVMEDMELEYAAGVAFQYRPWYGDPDDKSKATGDDRPLPGELMNRAKIYIEKRLQDDPEGYKKDIEESSSFNALVRKEMRKGNL